MESVDLNVRESKYIVLLCTVFPLTSFHDIKISMNANTVVYTLDQCWAKWACDCSTENADFGLFG